MNRAPTYRSDRKDGAEILPRMDEIGMMLPVMLSQPHTLPEQLTELGRRVRALRKRRKMTQAQLAERAGISTRTLRSLEQGDDVQLSTLLRVLRALGASDPVDGLLPSPDVSPLELARAQRREG